MWLSETMTVKYILRFRAIINFRKNDRVLSEILAVQIIIIILFVVHACTLPTQLLVLFVRRTVDNNWGRWRWWRLINASAARANISWRHSRRLKTSSGNC